MPLCVNREYRPSRDLDLEAVDLSRTPFGTYEDDATQSEFYRFVNRDIASIITGVIFGPGAMFYALVNVASIRAGSEAHYIVYIVFGAIVLLVAVLDLYLLWRRKALDVRTAWLRSRLAQVYCMAGWWSVGYPISATFAHCAEITDWFGYLYDRPAFTADKFERECIDIVNAYPLVGFGLGLTVIQVSPRLTAFNVMVLLLSFYLGYARTDVAKSSLGESTRELIAKLLVYVTFGVGVVLLKLMRYRSYQSQFETTLGTDRERRRATKAADEVDGMLQAMVPASALERLLTGEPVRDRVQSASVLFSDMVGFTQWSSSRSAEDVVEMLNVTCTRLDAEAEARGVVKIKTIGDAYWAVTGIPVEQVEHAEVLCAFAQRMHTIIADESSKHPHWGEVALRVGVASGAVDGGIFGSSRLSYEVSGPTCDLALICEQRGVKNRVCICSHTRALLEHSIEAPEAHVTVEVAAQGGAEEKLWLLQPERTNALFSTSVSTEFERAASHRSNSVASESTAASAMQPRGIAGVSAAKRRFLAARAALTTGHRGTTTTDEVSSEMQPSTRISSGRPTPRASPRPPGSSYAVDSHHPHRVSHADDEHYAAGGGESPSAVAMVEQGSNDENGIDTHRVSNNDDNDDDDDGEEGAVKHIGIREFSWVLMHFKDDDFEREYKNFVVEHHTSIRRACLALLVAVITSFAIGLIVEGAASDPAAIALISIAGAVAIASLVVAALTTLPPWIDAAGMHLSALLIVIGMWLLEWQSIFGHDLTYLHAILTIILGFGVSVWPAAVLLTLNVVLIIIPIGVQTHDSVWFGGNITFVTLSFVMLGFAFVGQEKQFRRQYVDLAVAQMAIDAQGRRALEQQALLLAIVPPHAVTPLTTWLSKGKDAAHTVNDSYSRLCVGFIRLVSDARKWSPKTAGTADREATTQLADSAAGGVSWLFEAHSLVDRVLEDYGNWFDKVKTMGDTVMVAGPFRCPDVGDHDTDGKRLIEAAPATPPLTQQQQPQHRSPSSPSPRGGGGQQSNAAVRRAACAVLDAVRDLHAAGGPFVCGLHVGEVMGVVLGTSRLCYDIFGDAVNTASRTMTSLKGALADEHADGAGAFCAVSSDFRTFVEEGVTGHPSSSPNGEPPAPVGLTFGEGRSAEAKGKASLQVHAVRFAAPNIEPLDPFPRLPS